MVGFGIINGYVPCSTTIGLVNDENNNDLNIHTNHV
jgi:hypothetical protein